MSWLSEIAGSAFVQSLGWTLLQFLWQGTVIALALALVLAILHAKSANARYLAGCIALAASALSPIATFTYSYSAAASPAASATSMKIAAASKSDGVAQEHPANKHENDALSPASQTETLCTWRIYDCINSVRLTYFLRLITSQITEKIGRTACSMTNGPIIQMSATNHSDSPNSNAIDGMHMAKTLPKCEWDSPKYRRMRNADTTPAHKKGWERREAEPSKSTQIVLATKKQPIWGSMVSKEPTDAVTGRGFISRGQVTTTAVIRRCAGFNVEELRDNSDTA